MTIVLLGSSIPILLAILVGFAFSRQRWFFWGLGSLSVATAYPILHWYVLRAIRQRYYDLLPKDEAVWASLTAHLAWWSVPLCFFGYLSTRWLVRRLART
ncbi:hypothetical protein EH31_12190 [Erythrobacter longus]|uniref:Uncharacterized protein n=1 Tax=Erythrobacter longus TaxID=1044 RepID=A0A074M7K6_ERYLO|nr:hypothetical protein EH31_12190 [Erythrobacter longus]